MISCVHCGCDALADSVEEMADRKQLRVITELCDF